MPITTISIAYETGETDTLSYDGSGWNIPGASEVRFAEISVADAMEYLARAMASLSEEYPKEVRPSVVTDLLFAFGSAAEAGIRLVEMSEMISNQSVDHLPDEAIGEILMTLVGGENRLSTETKKRAVGIAEHIGPDYAQALYRFAVLVTKLA